MSEDKTPAAKEDLTEETDSTVSSTNTVEVVDPESAEGDVSKVSDDNIKALKDAKIKEWQDNNKKSAKTVNKPAAIPAHEREGIVMLRKVIVNEQFAPLCRIVGEYQDQIKDIAENLKQAGKKCTNCALGPYRLSYTRQLLRDLKDSSIVTDEEVTRMKIHLGVDTIPLGLDDNGEVYGR